MASDRTDDRAPLTLDATDRAILRVLARHARISNKDLAAAVHLTPSPCRERVRRLEAHGVIRGYHAEFDDAALGLGLLLYVLVRLEDPRNDVGLLSLVAERPEIRACHEIAGQFDFLLEIRTASMARFRERVGEPLAALTGVLESRTMPVLAERARNWDLPLDG